MACTPMREFRWSRIRVHLGSRDRVDLRTSQEALTGDSVDIACAFETCLERIAARGSAVLALFLVACSGERIDVSTDRGDRAPLAVTLAYREAFQSVANEPARKYLPVVAVFT